MKSSALLLLWALFLAGCGSKEDARDPTTEDTSDPCHDADIAATRVWNEETRLEVKGKVMQWGGEIGGELAKKRAVEIENSMDRLTDDWARMRKAVCQDHFKRKTLSADQYQQRADCLDALLTRQRTFLTSLDSPQADVSEQLSGINEELANCRL